MSRLKRKLDVAFDGNVPSNLKLNENFCLIGTPLPPLEKSKDTGEFVPIWKQDVRDEQGRRRLHGAFTGGFSAGYFNTVGSKEGWTPQAFVSSRADRATRKQARPEDFMDDEDRAELRDSQKLVDTTEEMDITGGTQAELNKRLADGPKDEITTALESALLPTAQDSIGAQILKKMGWRPGQGVGPRVTWKQLKQQDMQSSNLSAAELRLVAVEDHDEASKHMYAPRDTKLPVFQRKANSHGLGYAPGATLHDSVESTQTGPSISAGFGLGALNDAEDDDVDVYDSAAPSSSRGRQLAYDMDMEPQERTLLGSQRSSGKATKTASIPTNDGVAQFQDGRRVVSGFVLSKEKVFDETVFPLPDVPPGWKPDPSRIWSQDPTLKTAVSAPPPTGNWKKTITADQRGAMLGETPLPAANRSVFDYLSQKDRDRLRALATGIPNAAPPPPVDIVIPTLEPRMAQAALKGFQPFTADAGKQARYTEYLTSQADGIPLQMQPRLDQGNEAFNQELAEYSKAAQIFKPVSGAMASRFTSAKVVELGPKAIEGLHEPSAASLFLTPEGEKQDSNVTRLQDPPKIAAAKAGMFGPMTRETETWFPARLLCKRFGVRDPHPEGPDADALARSAAEKQGQFEVETKRLAALAAPLTTTDATESGEPSVAPKKDLSNIGLGEDESQGRDTLTYKRPSMDIFKAIFADDSESEDEGGETKKDVQQPPVLASQPSMTPAPAPNPVSAQVPTAVAEKPQNRPSILTTKDDEPVDLATFRPTFVSRKQRETGTNGDDSKKSSKDKRGKKKSVGLISFDDEDGVEGPMIAPATKDKDRKREKKKRKNESTRKEEDVDDAMWVEKEVPDVVKVIVPAPVVPVEGPRGRKRAIDFL